MDPALVKISRERYTWYNASRNVEVTPLRFFYPNDEHDLARIVREAEKNGLRVRAVGSGHSFSEAPKGNDYLLSMKRMDGIWKTPPEQLKTAARDQLLVTAEAGTTIMRLTHILDKMGLALCNMGVIDVQTISGAMMTGTHGTGIGRPTVPDMVCSLKMVGKNGELLQVEPSDGITDPTKFDHQGPLRLIQRDDIFYSAILSFGALGIVYELTLEVERQFLMNEKRYLKPWSKLREEIESGAFMDQVRATEFMAFRVNPYEVKGDHLCALVEQEVVGEAKGLSKIYGLRRNLYSSVLGNLEYLVESSINRFRKKPSKVKKAIQLGLWATKDASYFDKSHKVLYQCGNAVIRYGISSEFAFPATSAKLIEVIEAIFEQARKNETEGGLFQSSHIPVRFVAPSKAYLSSAYCRETMYIDIPLLYGTTGDIEILERYQELMISLGGIPHWGKHNSRLYFRPEFIRQQFEELDTWLAARQEMDPNGTFLNDFIVKMGLSREPAGVPA